MFFKKILNLVFISILSAAILFTNSITVKALSDNQLKDVEFENQFEDVQEKDALVHPIQPPNNWNPITASDEEINNYGFPIRPKDSPQELREWENTVGKAKILKDNTLKRFNRVKKDTYKESLPEAVRGKSDNGKGKSDNGIYFNTTNQKSQNWAGYVYNRSSYPDKVSGKWTCPEAISSSIYTTADIATWVGLGGFVTNGIGVQEPLFQAGTMSHVNLAKQKSYYVWLETVGGAGNMTGGAFKTAVPVKAGDKMYVQTYIRRNYPTSDKYQIYWYLLNITQNVQKSYYQDITDTNNQPLPSTAEWIVEKPDKQYTGTRLAKFNPITFTECKFSSYWNSSFEDLPVDNYQYPSQAPYNINLDLYYYSTLSAYTHPVSGTAGTFTVDWKSY